MTNDIFIVTIFLNFLKSLKSRQGLWCALSIFLTEETNSTCNCLIAVVDFIVKFYSLLKCINPDDTCCYFSTDSSWCPFDIIKCLKNTVFLNIYLFRNKLKLILIFNIPLYTEYKNVLKSICVNNNAAFQAKMCWTSELKH